MAHADLAERLEEKAATPSTPGRSLFDLLRQMEPEFARALPKHVDTARFLRMALTTVRTNPGLLQATPESVLGGFMAAAQLGLEISDVRGQAFLIPRKSRQTGRTEATFQLGYRGLIDMAWRSGISVEVREVYPGERFHVRLGTDSGIDHEWSPTRDGDPIAYYAVAHFADDRRPQFDIMTEAEIEEHRDRFAGTTKQRSPWAEHFSAMARKTVIKRVLNPLPLSAQYSQAVAADDKPILADLNDTFRVSAAAEPATVAGGDVVDLDDTAPFEDPADE